MKKLLTIILLLAVTVAFGQKKPILADTSFTCDSCTAITSNTNYFLQTPYFKNDTIKVLAYCHIRCKRFKWIRMYGIELNGAYFTIGDMVFYSSYLMPDRKTKSIYKVIYSINNNLK